MGSMTWPDSLRMLDGKQVRLEFGPVDAALENSDVVVEGEYWYEGSTHAPIEPHCCVAEYDATGQVTAPPAPRALDLFTVAVQEGVITVDTKGISGWDLRTFTFERVPRPLFPLDDIEEWHAKP